MPPQPTSVIHNLQSADTFSGVIDHKLNKELALGRILGPYHVVPNYPNYRISTLGVVPKKTLGEFRMIHHLSFPEGSSVNDFIPKEMSSVQYATIQDAISFIQRSPQSVYMAIDVESAFRIMPVSPADRPLLGFQWLGKFYMDAVLSIGCFSSSCAIFECFSSALEWAAKYKLGATEVVHVIDDFLFMAHSAGKCEHDLMAFIDICHQLGVSLAPGKTVGPLLPSYFWG